MRALALLVLAAALLLLMGAGSRTQAAGPTPDGYSLALFATAPEFNQIVDLAVIPGQEDEAIVASQTDDLLWRISLTGSFAPALYGDLTAVSGGAGSEEGLLSVAFSPQFESDGRVYVYYTQGSPDPSIVSRFDATATDLDEGTEQAILEVPQPDSNHNGGRLLFGPDGYLYLSLGDGGGGGDPEETGQDNTDLLASVLRISVTGEAIYSVPADNPFVGVSGADEVWAYGLRNPWRYSFDRMTGELWLGDVGQGAWEEVEEIVKGGNYGWDCYEGFESYEPVGCPASGFRFPRAVYGHGLGCAVTGGYVYRGSDLPEIYGWYVYADYCSGRIWAVNPDDSSDGVQLVDSPYSISSFAELPDGELLVLTFQEAIYQLDCSAALDADGDGLGNACDPDDDNDRVFDVAETLCGSDPLNAAKRPERLDLAGDDDGDGMFNEALPGGSSGLDCDGDGWTGAQEALIFGTGGTVSDQDSCGNNGWPADLDPNNLLSIGDLNSFIFPNGPDDGHGVFAYFGHPVPDAGRVNEERWDLSPNGVIDIGDINALNPMVRAASARPPMFNGQQAFFAGACPWPP